MSQEKVQTQTIVRDEHVIIIAHPPVKQQKNLWDTITDLFKSDTPIVQNKNQPQLIITPPETAPVVITPVSVQSDTTPVKVEVIQESKPQSSIDWSQWAKYFSRQNIKSYYQNLNTKYQQFNNIDTKLSNDITKFKEENLLSLGDIRVRSILMSFSSAVLYRMISYNTTGLLRKTRNLGFSFVFMGYWFVPQLFNPFLRKPGLAQNIV